MFGRVAKAVAFFAVCCALVAVVDGEFVHPTLCDSSVRQTAGYIKAGDGPLAPKYFFWLFESKSKPSTDPLIMWATGGPGFCSSQLALFAENGPCRVSQDGTSTIANKFSWHNNANVMWVDQSGVGFASGRGIAGGGKDVVASNMFVFLQKFFKAHPQYTKSEFYIFGESLGGAYVPAIAHRIWRENKQAGGGVKIPMKGIAIGNGLTNPEEQYKWYAKMAREGGKDVGGNAPGIVSATKYQAMKAATPLCIKAIRACNVRATGCPAAVKACRFAGEALHMNPGGGRNPYDLRKPCVHGNLCYNFDHIQTYLNSDTVTKSLGVTKGWAACSYMEKSAFFSTGQWAHDFSTDIPDLLNDGLEVLIYAGDMGYWDNLLGITAWTKTLDWCHKDEFNKAGDEDWQVGKTTVGRLRSANHFHFMQVFSAGHMVAVDQPEVSLEMVNQFIGGKLRRRRV